MLEIAERAIERAQMTVVGLPPTATPADIAVANAALAQAQAHLAVVSLNPQVMQILTQRRLDHLETVAEKRAVVSESLEAAQMAVDDLTDESTDEDVSDARDKVDMALAALAASGLSEADSDGLSQSIAGLNTTVIGIETARAEAAEEAYKTALAGVTSEIATAKTLADALTDESSAADVTAANNAVSAAQTALNDAGLTADDTTTQQAAITALTTTISDGEADRTAHRTMVAEAKVVSDSDAAKTKTKAITAEAGETGDDDAGLGGSTASAIDAGDAGSYELDIKRDADGTTITVTVNGANDDADVTFMKYTDLDGAAGHKGQMQTRSMDAGDDGNVVTEVALVYTDIDAPVATAFGTVHTLDVRVDGEDATVADPDDALHVVADDLTHVKASKFTAPAGTVGTTVLRFQHEVEDTANTDEDESMTAAEIMGTFEGAMGTYKCNADSECTVTVDTKGVVSEVSNDNDWIFIPADGATVDVADTDYLQLRRLAAADCRQGRCDHLQRGRDLRRFVGCQTPEALPDVTGSATYEGGAAGVYVKNVFTSEGAIDTATSGHFTADAELTAYFGQTVNDPATLNVNEADQIADRPC